MNSLNHYSYGSVIEFLYAWAAGLRPAEDGFQHAVIAPVPNFHLRELSCTYLSPAGKYAVEWKICKDGMLSVKLEIPFQCTAQVSLPESGKEPFTLSAGIYEYSYFPLADYRQKYTEDTPLSVILADEEAKEILLNAVPQAAGLDNPVDGTLPLRILYERGFIGITKEMADQAIHDLKQLKYE